MKKHHSLLTVAVFTAAFALAVPPAARACDNADVTDDYDLEYIDLPESLGHPQFAWMNQQGLIAIQTYEGGAAVLDRGVWLPIAVGTYVMGADQPNAQGQVGITFTDPTVPGVYSQGAIYRHGRFTWMGEIAGYPGFNYTVQGLNDRGMVTISIWDPEDPMQIQRGVVLDRFFRPIRELDCPANTLMCLPLGINNLGAIAGAHMDTAGSLTAFVSDSRNNFHPISFPGYANSVAYSINDRNEAVGFYFNDWFTFRSFLYKDGRLCDFYIPDSLCTAVCSIDNNGQLCGVYALPSDGLPRIFVATPRHGRHR